MIRVVVQGKYGEGKTTVAQLIARALEVEFPNRVELVDDESVASPPAIPMRVKALLVKPDFLIVIETYPLNPGGQHGQKTPAAD